MSLASALPKAVVFFVLVGGIQGLVAGETVLEKFPSPGDALEVSEGDEICIGWDAIGVEKCLPDLVSAAVGFITWPFDLASWFINLAGLGFIDGMPGWITVPMKLAAISVTAMGVFEMVSRLMESLGQVIPLT